jgi:hypothetical protein
MCVPNPVGVILLGHPRESRPSFRLDFVEFDRNLESAKCRGR